MATMAGPKWHCFVRRIAVVSTPRRALSRPLTLALIAAFAIAMLPGGTARPVLAVSPDVVISQVYGGGGGTGASYTNDYVELFNRGASSASLSGMSVQYASAAGTGTFGGNPVALLSGTLSAGGYYLVQLAGGATGAALPTPDATGTANMSGTAGKVALVDSTSGMACNGGSTPCSAAQLALIRDLVGYGTTANFYEGSAPAPAPSTTTSILRGAAGCTDTDQNGSDFSSGTPAARNTASPLSPCPVGDAAPSVASSTPSDGASNVAANASLSVTFSEAVLVASGAITLTCGGVEKAVSVSGDPGTTFDLTYIPPLPDGATCEIAISAAGITDTDTDDPPDAMAANVTIDFTVASADPCGATDTPIGAIQGSGASAALTGTRTVQGIVVGDYEGPSPALRGFYVQDAGDGNAATSDGIFVFNNIGGTSPDLVSLGQVVQVTGNAGENQGQTQLSASSVVDCDVTGAVTPTAISFPVADATYLERYEGMLVRVPETMTVTEHFQLGRFGQVVISSEGRLQNPTAVVEPGAPALALQAANNLRKIIVDDAAQSQNPDPILFARGGDPLSATNTLRGGDTITDLTGVMTYTWAGNSASGNAYRIRPINAMSGRAQFVAVNERPGALEVDGDIRVAAMNLLNYFNTFGSGCARGVGGPATDCRGASNQAEFDRQVAKTVPAILGLDADVVGVNEIENDGHGPTSAIAHLVDQLNLVAGAGTYAFIDVDTATGQLNALGDDAIKVGLIYRPAAITPVGDTAVLNTPAFTLGGDDPDQIPPDQPKLRSRPSLAQAFETPDGARFIVDVNHLKSKGSPCQAPSDLGDGQGNCSTVRTNAATELAAWLDTDPTGTGDDDVLIMGDLNSYAKEDPITVLTEAGYTNLVDTFLGPDAYSYVFDGQWGYLDHALASPSVVDQVAAVVEWHINADEPAVLDYNTDFKSAGQIASLYAPDRFRVSDHDPIIVGLDAASDVPTVDAGGPYSVEELGSVQLSATGSDPTGDDVSYAWDLDGDATFETAGQSVTFSAGTLQAPQTVTVSVRITDEHGQSSTDTATIDVIWDFGGFLPPASGGSATAKAGSSLPVKFSLAGDQGLGVLDGTPVVQRWDCSTEAPIGGPFPAAQSEPFSYDPLTDEYKFVWKTNKAWANTCATLTVALDDGQSYTVDVSFTK